MRRWMGLLARLRTTSRQASRSLCTSAVSWTCLPVALLRACYNRVGDLRPSAEVPPLAPGGDVFLEDGYGETLGDIF